MLWNKQEHYLYGTYCLLVIQNMKQISNIKLQAKYHTGDAMSEAVPLRRKWSAIKKINSSLLVIYNVVTMAYCTVPVQRKWHHSLVLGCCYCCCCCHHLLTRCCCCWIHLGCCCCSQHFPADCYWSRSSEENINNNNNYLCKRVF